MKTNYIGIDYSNGKSNVDNEAGIHYGVISIHEVLQAWADESESVYSGPFCPECQGDAEEINADNEEISENYDNYSDYESDEYFCQTCQITFGNESAFSEDPDYFKYEQDGYIAVQSGDDTDIFIIKSPYFTYCQYCSPCAPGAGYLTSYMDEGEGIKAYCFGADWFDNEKVSYPVYSVETGELIKEVNEEI